MVRRIENPGSDVQRLCGDSQRLCQLLQHLCRRLAKAPLDLAEIRIRYPGLIGELTQCQLSSPPLAGDELTERTELIRDLLSSDSYHVPSVLAIASTCKLAACKASASAYYRPTTTACGTEAVIRVPSGRRSTVLDGTGPLTRGP
jgi:hypothetical protein